MKYAVHDKDGRVLSVSEWYGDPEQMRQTLVASGRMWVEIGTTPVPEDLHDAVVTICPRPNMPVTVSKTEIAADGEDIALLSGLPMPCRVRVATADHSDVINVADGSCEITAAVPDTYNVTVEAWPYRDFTVSITAI
jgi:hypothetical protein